MKICSVVSQKIVTQTKCHSRKGGVIPVFARKCDSESTPFRLPLC
jgi:hypothetical protein